jgi:hypothetical protein
LVLVSAERSPFIQAILDYAAPITLTKPIALLGDENAAFMLASIPKKSVQPNSGT